MMLPPPPVLYTVAADTVVSLEVRDRLAEATDIAILVGALSMAVLAVLLVRVVLRGHAIMEELRRSVQQNLGPVSDRARGISDNVEFITGAVRTDVARLTDSVKALTDRLHQASGRMEERIEEFNALMEVVQSEAEDIFIDTAATVRGVRVGVSEGTKTIGRSKRDDRAGSRAGSSSASAPPTRRAQAEPRSGVEPAPEADVDEEGRARADVPSGTEVEPEPTGPGTPRR